MENLVFLLSAVFAYGYTTAPKKLKTYPVGRAGATVYLPENFKAFDRTTTQHGDEFYIGECKAEKAGYGVLYIDLKDEYSMEDAETMLMYYISRLQEPFSIAHNTGIGYCKSMNNISRVVKLVDYWQDEDGKDWKLKGYTDGKFIAVLYVQNISEVDVAKQEVFLEGLNSPQFQLV
jgi:hypothetical protein